MKAAICRRYGSPDVVEVVDVPQPVPKHNEVLVRIAATTVSTGDWRIRAMAVPRGLGTVTRLALGFNKPRIDILGSELSGEVVAAGSAVTRFTIGDQVVAFPGVRMACHAEFRVIPEDGPILSKPASLSHEEAAALFFGGTTALHFLRDKGAIRAGHRVLIIGASGSIGTAAIQLARHFGTEVTAVCSSANSELVKNLGAQHVIDYTREDFTKNGCLYDLILDTVDAQTWTKAQSSLTAQGRLLMVAADLPAMIGSLRTLFTQKKALCGVAPERLEDMQFLVGLAESGVYRPVVDSVYTLDKISAAHARVESGRKRGNVVVCMAKLSDPEAIFQSSPTRWTS